MELWDSQCCECGGCVAGKAHMYDLSVSQERMYEAVEAVRDRMHAVSEDVVTIGFGHFGDGNLHLLVADAREQQDAVSPRILLPTESCCIKT